MSEAQPLAVIHAAVMEFLRDKDDAALFGAQAVNAYVDEARATQDVDIMSPHAKELAEQIRQHLNDRFHIAARVREIRDGVGFQVFQLQKPKNRHLVDVRSVPSLPPTQRVAQVLVLTPVEPVASKVIAFRRRRGTPKSFTDRRDIALLLLKFPELKSDPGPVRDRLNAGAADEQTLTTWQELVAEDIRAEDEEEGY